MDASNLWTDTQRAFRRLIRSDFQQEHATDDERRQLSGAPTPITDPLAQDYAAWRRSLLWIAGVALIALAIFQFATFTTQEGAINQARDTAIAELEKKGGFEAQQKIQQIKQNTEGVIKQFGTDNLETIDGIFMMLILPGLIGGAMALMAARKWLQVRASRKLARIGFLIMFITPFVMAVLPVKEMLEFGHLQEEHRKQVAQLYGLSMGLSYFMLIGPRAIALFPGIIRSAMGLKTLIPESPMPGWASTLVAPLYSIFILVVFALINQMYGNTMLLIGLACFMIAPLVYVRKGRDILRPHRPEEVSQVVAPVRRASGLFTLIGAVFIAIFIIDTEMLGVDGFVKFFMSIIGSVVLLSVVGSDFLLAVLKAGHEQSKALVESQMEDDLEKRFDSLTSGGFTDLKTLGPDKGPVQPPPPPAPDA